MRTENDEFGEGGEKGIVEGRSIEPVEQGPWAFWTNSWHNSSAQTRKKIKMPRIKGNSTQYMHCNTVPAIIHTWLGENTLLLHGGTGLVAKVVLEVLGLGGEFDTLDIHSKGRGLHSRKGGNETDDRNGTAGGHFVYRKMGRATKV